jgi:hypothetical protein
MEMWEGCRDLQSWVRKVKLQLIVVVHDCNPSYSGNKGRRISV